MLQERIWMTGERNSLSFRAPGRRMHAGDPVVSSKDTEFYRDAAAL